MIRPAVTSALAALGTIAVLGGAPGDSDDASLRALGGPATVEDDSPDAFGFPVPGLSAEDRRGFSVGNALFRDNWVVAPASAESRDGLGPLFNANSCSACHPNDGRGRPPTRPGEVGLGVITLVSPGAQPGAAHSEYGRQLQDQAIPGVAPEVRVEFDEEITRGTFADGSPYELIRLRPRFEAAAYGPLGDVRVSVRVGPQIIGGGLIEAVPDAALLAAEDPEDRDGDGISGRAHRLPGSGRVGRFGWKASQATLEDQTRAALSEDIGITSDEHPVESTTVAQRAVIRAPTGGTPEIDAHRVRRIAHYCRALAVPAQRGAGSGAVERGRRMFQEAGCTACHAPTLVAGDSASLVILSGAVFHPYSDLLLHDMGTGLADDRPDGQADGSEWRTPPLWGVGLVPVVNGHGRYLHDGRARSLQEAVLWHGGEAQRAREAFLRLSASDRAALLAFLESL